eukprot:g7612.t1
MRGENFSLAGELTGYGHRLIQRVYYEDTDFSGVVYHARYLHFLERGRTDYLRCLGCEQSALLAADDEGLVFVVHRMEIDFKRPARMDDILTITTATEKAGGAKMVLNQTIRRDDDTLIVAKVVIAVVNKHGRPRRLPETVADNLWALFMQAGLIVKLVMLGLIGASIWTWAIVIDKYVNFAKARRQFDQFEQVFWSGQSLEELYRTLADRQNGGLAAIFVAAMREWKKSFERGARSPIGLQMRIDRAMDVTMARESEGYEARLGSLATIGSAGPFVGLFGTVVGIMTSFQAIAGSKSTNLAVVAPGIAEALLATAIGLVAAIPAVIAYNKFMADAGKLSARMEGFADEFSAILSRQIDEKLQPRQAAQ